MKIYVVIGICGEYSDKRQWLVKAHKIEEDARDHVLLATANAKKCETYMDINGFPDWKDVPDYIKINEMDPQMFSQLERVENESQIGDWDSLYNCGSVHYHYEEVELL